MSAKPATLPVWDSNKTNVTTPSGGQQTDGYATNAMPPSGIWNFLFGWITSWLSYLSDGIIQHSTKTLSIPASAGVPDVPTSWTFVANASVLGTWEVGTVPGGADALMFPICLEVGERIKAIRVYLRDTSAAQGALQMSLWDTPASGNSAQIGSTQTSAGDGTLQTLTLGSLTTTITSGHAYAVRISAGVNDTDHQIRLVEVDYDRVTS